MTSLKYQRDPIYYQKTGKSKTFETLKSIKNIYYTDTKKKKQKTQCKQ